ncbi:MAG: ATP-binding protein [Thermoproteus sp. AZ2]|jgi:hypothetical protein|uniref:ATP-binding protein n=1 Tax=Thermoproteus sp. AZ2 TaxID=1609232 RepID=A0ACC6UZZ4_9CREN
MEPPIVTFGPEGCGKTTILKQAAHMLRKLGYEVFYLNPLEREFLVEVDDADIKTLFFDFIRQTFSDEIWGRVVFGAIDLVRELLKRRKKKVAILADDVFQAIGLNKAAMYVNGLLGIIEYPPGEYEGVVALAATGEGVSRWEIGRHRWAELRPMWNIVREGFVQLYEKVPGPKPPFEDVWKMAGGNPWMIAKLYMADRDVRRVVSDFIQEKWLPSAFVEKWRRWLVEAVEDPDVLWDPDAPEELINELTSRNLIVYMMYPRDSYFWIDQPPPERDLEIGVGEHVAWHSPLHREAVKAVLNNA